MFKFLLILWLIFISIKATEDENTTPNSLTPDIEDVDIDSNDQIYHILICENYCIGCCVDNKCFDQTECEVYFFSAGFIIITVILLMSGTTVLFTIVTIIKRIYNFFKKKDKAPRKETNYSNKIKYFLLNFYYLFYIIEL